MVRGNELSDSEWTFEGRVMSDGIPSLVGRCVIAHWGGTKNKTRKSCPKISGQGFL